MRAMLGLSRHRFRIMHLCTTAKAFAPTDTNGKLIVDWPWVLILCHPFQIIFFTSLRHPVFLSFLCTFIMTSFGFRMESHLILFHFMFYPSFCCITFLLFSHFQAFSFSYYFSVYFPFSHFIQLEHSSFADLGSILQSPTALWGCSYLSILR